MSSKTKTKPKEQSKDKDLDVVPISQQIKEITNQDKSDEPREFISESFFSVNWKLKILLFLIFMLVCSTMFINDIISRMGSDMVDNTRTTTNKGTIVQGVLLVLIYSFIETLVKSKIV